jgi:hypothetical protein
MAAGTDDDIVLQLLARAAAEGCPPLLAIPDPEANVWESTWWGMSWISTW